ncbi:cell division protein ZapD [Castellaniella caeni]|uniref:cell division protein ZapD n=1 Tax=Castellaniella caeni TaxID=266123 RepID=UPI0008350C2B|nr:cell division protein ZapD [Castellaniella caeni]
MILYEYPCNERVRTLLRVEYLFDRLFFFTQGEDPRCHQIAMATLFDLLDVCERADVRTAVLQDLDRHRTALSALREHPGVDRVTLDGLLTDIQAASAALVGQGRVGQCLRDNEWLAGLRGRITVPGSSSPVDLPSYYAWQLKSPPERMRDLQGWVDPLMPLHRAAILILKLLRDAGDAHEQLASQGAYQEMLGGKTFQLLRVWVEAALAVFPEISANKYVIWVRFSSQDNQHKPQPAGRDIAFRLARCNL